MLRFLVIASLLLISCASYGQDTLKVEKKPKSTEIDTSHSPRTATILSAVIPGAGQVYNKKYWKVPIVYAGIGISVYYIVDNNRQHNFFKDAYLARLDSSTIHVGTDLERFSESGLRTLADQYRRRRDLSYVITAVFYFLNIIDANVDAHMIRFDVGEDLSLEADPILLPRTFSGFNATPQPGLRLRLKF